MPEIQEQIQDYRWPDPLLPLLLTPVLSPVMCVSVCVCVCLTFLGICLSSVCVHLCLSGSERSALWDWAACTVKMTCWTWMGTLSESAKWLRSSWLPWEIFCESPVPLLPPE